jgi:hypothetical protein
MNDWIYKGKPISEIPKGIFGFIYIIRNNITGRQYIGKKQFLSNRSKKIPGKKNRKHTILPSDWLLYWSSSDGLKKDITLLGQENFNREIIRLCPTKRDLTFREIEEQIKNDVLTALLPDGSRAYYNENIMSRWFVQPKETIQKMSESAIKLWKDPKHREKQKQKSQSEEVKKKHSKRRII